jgi:hypothetical protein
MTIWMGSRALLTFSDVAVKMATGCELGASAADSITASVHAAKPIGLENELT